MPYSIEVTRTAEKQLKKLSRNDQRRVIEAVVALANDPYPNGVRKLTGYNDVFRIRVGRFRVIYSVSRKKLVVIILKVGHRKDVYR